MRFPVCHCVLLIVAFALVSCCAPPEEDPAPVSGGNALPENWIYLYARLHESQPKASAENQYLDNLNEALADYQAEITVEELFGAEGEIEYTGIDFKIAAPAAEQDALMQTLVDAFRVSGAPYHTTVTPYAPASP